MTGPPVERVTQRAKPSVRASERRAAGPFVRLVRLSSNDDEEILLEALTGEKPTGRASGRPSERPSDRATGRRKDRRTYGRANDRTRKEDKISCRSCRGRSSSLSNDPVLVTTVLLLVVMIVLLVAQRRCTASVAATTTTTSTTSHA